MSQNKLIQVRAADPCQLRLLQAATTGDLATLQAASDTDLQEAVCCSGCNVLHWAAGTNQVDVLHYLVTERGFSPHVLTNDAFKAGRKNRRTPLHYACRNGCLETARALVKDCGADPNPADNDNHVTPFQLAVWQNHLHVCRFLVDDCGVDPAQVNAFDCGAVHWLGLAPVHRANHHDDGEEDGSALIPLAKWLAAFPNMNLHARQRHGHSALHKAAWGGHVALVRYWHEQHDLWDDGRDKAGNYAADLADMASSPRHTRVAEYLRHHCSRQRYHSYQVLQLSCANTTDPSFADIRRAYLRAVRQVHPDRIRQRHEEQKEETTESTDDFDAVCKAYHHLTLHEGRGSQCNPAHSLPLLLLHEDDRQSATTDTTTTDDDDEQVSCFKARLLTVIQEHGDEGLDLSNLKKKWKQVWPDTPFPEPPAQKNKRTSLSDFFRQLAGDVVSLRFDHGNSNCLRLHAKPVKTHN